MKDYEVSAKQVVGIESIFGFIMSASLMFLFSTIPCPIEDKSPLCIYGTVEDVFLAFKHMSTSTILTLFVFGGGFF